MATWLYKGLAAVVGVFVLYLVLVFGASESGEVVQLVTEDAQGEAVTTRLWVADTDGAMWLRAGDGTSGWYQRLTAHSAENPATLIRGDHTYAITASPEPQRIAEINQLMADKYGLGDTLVGMLAGSPDSGIAVRVVVASN